MKKLNKLTCRLACLLLCAIGLSAHAQFMATTNSATFGWNAVVDANLSGYQLFYWTGTLTNVHTVPAGQLTERVVNLNWNSLYTAALKSVAQQGTNTLVSTNFSTAVTLITPAAPPPPLLPPSAPTGLRILGP